MKRWPLLSVLMSLVLIDACQDQQEFRVDRRHSTPSANITHSYPMISGAFPDSILTAVNQSLFNMTDLNYKLANELDFDSLHSDYKLLYENDSLLSLEFFKVFYADDQIIKSYYPRVMHKSDLSFYMAPEALWPGFSRELLLDYFDTSYAHIINANAYVKDSRTVISFALAHDSIIVYPGEEGEFRGKYRVAIPAAELGL